MFTGIIKHRGTIIKFDGASLLIETELAKSAAIGDSYAIDGICLTVTKIQDNEFAFDLVAATKAVTTAINFQVGQSVHVEPALMASSLIGGHLVTGHVDTTLPVLANQAVPGSWQLQLAYTSEFRPYIIPKGSLAVNGVSLTIQEVLPDSFVLELIPETLRATNLAQIKLDTHCNVEFDTMAKTIWHQLSLMQANSC